MKGYLIKRKERKLEEQQSLRALAEDMLKRADIESDKITLEEQVRECQRTIMLLLEEIRELRVN